jgi:hypothetical protein
VTTAEKHRKTAARGCVVNKQKLFVTLIALGAMALFVTMTTFVSADTPVTTTTTTGATTTTTDATGGSSTTSPVSTTVTTDATEWWIIRAYDFKDFGVVPSSISVSDRRIAWTGITPGGFSSIYIWDMVRLKNMAIPQPLPGNFYNPCSDGKLVVYQGSRAGGYDDLFLYNLDNKTVRQLTHNTDPGDANDSSPRIDDNRVVWKKDMTGAAAKPGIYLLQLDNPKQVCILPGGEYSDPDISGDWVVAVKNAPTGTTTEIVLYNLVTKETLSIAPAGTNNEHPRINGSFVVWSSGEPPTAIYYPWNTYQIMAYNIANGKSAALTDNEFGNATPSIYGTFVGWEQQLDNGIGVLDFGERRIGLFSKDEKDPVHAPEVAEGGYMVYYGGTNMYYAWPEKFGFIDAQPGDDYATAIKTMAEKTIIEGYDPGDSRKPTYFGTFDLVTRQQYAKMILLTMAAWDPVVYTPSFHDTLTFADAASIAKKQGDLYPYYYVAKAARTGLTFGFPDGTFRPEANITRQQVISMIVRAARDNFVQPPENWAGLLSYIDKEHGERIRMAEYNGLLDGITGGTLGGLYGWDTREYATRGEVAQMLYNLMKILGVVPK